MQTIIIRTTDRIVSPWSSRRGVSSVLAMMFLVIFGSLAAAMAVVAQSNLRTADSGLKLSRAMSAAETGLVFATHRLADEASRFVVSKGTIDAAFAEKLWLGTYNTSTDGSVDIRPPVGYTTSTTPSGIIYAVRAAHAYDDGLPGSHSAIIESGDSSLPKVEAAIGRLRVRPIKLSNAADSPYFRLTYEMLAGVPYVRVSSEGVDGDIHRTLQLDFKIDKKIEYAILSPNRIMIGKNVVVEGPLGSRFGLVSGELASANGDPLVLRSDFYYLNTSLNTKLNTLYSQILNHDVDGDSRLRPDHPLEKAGLSGQPALIDYDGDQYVDDFDLFLAQFDTNNDHRVCYSTTRAQAAGLGALAQEFTVDTQLGRLVDEANPDRDHDGVITSSDTGLGYMDGVLDSLDEYAKVRGKLAFSVARSAWDSANGSSYQNIVQGPVRYNVDTSPVNFAVPDTEMLEITTAMFATSQSWFNTQTNGVSNLLGDSSSGQAQSQSGGSNYTAAASNPDWEAVPYGATGAYDYYRRPIYKNMTFTNVRIPKGTNALFENCKFVGVTYVGTETNCSDHNWNYAGSVEQKETAPGSGIYYYPLHFPAITASIGSTSISDTRVESNNIRFHNCTFLGSISGDKPSEYTHWRNKIQMTGNTRFYIDPDDTDLATQSDAATLRGLLNGISAANRKELAKSSILLPGWSVDVGNFNNQQNADPLLTPKIKLKGTIVAGIIDVRGTADIYGTVLSTFRPTAGTGPLFYGGLPDAFNSTIGYFGPLDGDGEGVDQASATFTGFGQITMRYDRNAALPDGIPWPIRADPAPETYAE